MSYRNINVNGIDYKWVAGKTALKIVGPNGFSKIVQYADPSRVNKVTPADVKNSILGFGIDVEKETITHSYSESEYENW